MNFSINFKEFKYRYVYLKKINDYFGRVVDKIAMCEKYCHLILEVPKLYTNNGLTSTFYLTHITYHTNIFQYGKQLTKIFSIAYVYELYKARK